MAKGKQPYIPLYIGDWIQDTDCLSIEAEGAWLRIVFKCWKNNGMFSATEDVFARVCKVDTKKFASILLEWQQNNICDIVQGENGIITVLSRRIRRDKEISAVRSEIGSKGGSKTQAKGKANSQAKVEQKPEYDNDNEVEFNYELKKSEEKVEKIEFEVDSLFVQIFDDLYLERAVRPAFRNIDLNDQLEKFKAKVRGAPGDYKLDDTGRMRNAFLYQLRQVKPDKPKINGISKSKMDEFKNL